MSHSGTFIYATTVHIIEEENQFFFTGAIAHFYWIADYQLIEVQSLPKIKTSSLLRILIKKGIYKSWQLICASKQ